MYTGFRQRAMKYFRVLITVVSALLLCSCWGNKDLEEPVEAPEIGNRLGVHEAWSDSAGGSDEMFSQLSPAVMGNTIFVAARDGTVNAIRVTDGHRLWETDLSDEDENDDKRSARLAGGIGLGAGRVAVGSENGWLYILDQSDGKIAWKTFVGNEVISRPTFALSGSRIFVQDSRGRIVCYSPAGEQLWVSGESRSLLRLRAQSSPVALGDDYLLVGTSTGKVQILSQQDGSVVNQIVIGKTSGPSTLSRVADVSSNPLILNGSLYSTAYNSGFVQYSFEKAAVIFRLAYTSSKDIAFDDHFFVITGDNGHVHCISRETGSELWTNTKLTYRNVSAPVIYGNYVVVGDMEGYVYFLSLQDGNIESQLDTDDTPIYVKPLVCGNNVLIQTSGGELTAFHYDPGNIAAAKSAEALAELAMGTIGVQLAAASGTGTFYSSGITKEKLMERRAEAAKVVAQMEAQQRSIDAQLREYERQKAEYLKQKAEYERQVAEYEKRRREQLSGFGLMPGVKSDTETETEEVSEPEAPEEPALTESAAAATPSGESAAESTAAEQGTESTEDGSEKAIGFGIY